MFFNFVSHIEPKNVNNVLDGVVQIRAMQDELHEFKMHNVKTLVPRLYGMKIVGIQWVFSNERDENKIITRNKARIVAHGFTQL